MVYQDDFLGCDSQSLIIAGTSRQSDHKLVTIYFKEIHGNRIDKIELKRPFSCVNFRDSIQNEAAILNIAAMMSATHLAASQQEVSSPISR